MPVKPVPDGYRNLTPHLFVSEAAAATAFHARALGAAERMRRTAPNGHAELVIGGSRIMLADEFCDHGARHGRGGGA